MYNAKYIQVSKIMNTGTQTADREKKQLIKMSTTPKIVEKKI